ncbi:MAG: serine/threonine protein kinase [Chloroflexi bacterium]|nr:serine/threonine protein kinase [Chloroflexota bacterium]
MRIYSEGELIENRYEVVSILGHGATGIVYLALDKKDGIKRAIKHIFPSDGTDKREFKDEIFKREAKVLSDLKHPAIPEIHGFFSTPDGCYLVMDFIEGHSLKAELKERGKTFSNEEVIDISLQVCDVLQYLHDNPGGTLLFRDLKPSNIMLTPEGKIFLIDFGIAKKFLPETNGSTIHLGTVGYAPPEQYKKSGKISPASDIYSLGATMYHLLTGDDPSLKTPFKIPSPRIINKRVSRGMDSVVKKALSYNQEERFGSAGELGLILQKLKHNPSLTLSRIYEEETSEVKRKGIGSLLLLLLLLLIAIMAWRLNSHREQPKKIETAVEITTRKVPEVVSPKKEKTKIINKGAYAIIPMRDKNVQEKDGDFRPILTGTVRDYYSKVWKSCKDCPGAFTEKGPDIPHVFPNENFGWSAWRDGGAEPICAFYPHQGVKIESIIHPWEQYDLFRQKQGMEIFLPSTIPGLLQDKMPLGNYAGSWATSKGIVTILAFHGPTRIFIKDKQDYWLTDNSFLFVFAPGKVKYYDGVWGNENGNIAVAVDFSWDVLIDKKGEAWLGPDEYITHTFGNDPMRELLHIGRDSTEAIGFSNFKALMPVNFFVDNEERLWLTRGGRMLSFIKDGRLSLQHPGGASENVVATMSEDGIFWALDDMGKLFRGSQNENGNVDWKEESSVPAELVFQEDISASPGHLSATAMRSTFKNFSYCNKGAIYSEILPFEFQSKIYAGPDGNVWVSRLGNLYLYSNGKWSKPDYPEKIGEWMKGNRLIHGIQIDEKGNLWLRVLAKEDEEIQAVIIRSKYGWYVLI